MEFSEPKGIYLQIADQIRETHSPRESGSRENAYLPSGSSRSSSESIPNTVTKSYQKLLERELISNQRGRGYFVGERAAERALNEMKEEFMRDELPRIIGAMRLLGIRIDEIADALTRSVRLEHKGDDTP